MGTRRRAKAGRGPTNPEGAARRRLFYSLGREPHSVFVGVKIGKTLNDGIERDWPASGRRKADFIRLLIEEGLKAWRAGNISKPPGGIE